MSNREESLSNKTETEADNKPNKKVEFSRPTLKIPLQKTYDKNPYSAHLSNNVVPPMERKKSQFVFDHFNDFKHLTYNTAKSGLGRGEKLALIVYKKVKTWSKKWFTHLFLTIVLVAYTIGGAVTFTAIESPHEDELKEIDLRASRKRLIEDVSDLLITRLEWNHTTGNNTIEEWLKVSTPYILEYSNDVLDNHKTKKFLEQNQNNKKSWTIANSVVYCATIYTTIEAPRRKLRNRKFRREPTPIRTFENDEESSASLLLSKTPSSNSRSSSIEKQVVTNKHSFLSDINRNIIPSENEVKEFYQKTKKSLTNAVARGRERFRKKDKDLIKRSKSAPVENRVEDINKKEILDADKLNTSLISYLKANNRENNTPRQKSVKIIKPLVQYNKQKHSIPKRLDPVKLRDVLVFMKSISIPEVYRSFRDHCRIHAKHEYVKITNLYRKCIGEIIAIMILAGLGGLIFKLTEGSFESFYKCGVKRVKRDFLDLLWTKSHNLREDDWKFLARSKLKLFEEELHAAHEAGMTDYSGQRSWSFLNGVVYSLTVITTIGYGHMFPKTNTGRALTIVYALIGIPLFLIALTDFGKLFTRCIKFVWSYVRRFYYTRNCRKVRRSSVAGAHNIYDILWKQEKGIPTSNAEVQDVETPTSPTISAFEIDDEFNLPISVALFILVSYIFCGAVLYMVIEQWNFFESFYFVFVSMTTIGFGDYVPRNPIFMIGSIVYLVFGLALMSMCINVVQVKLSDTFKRASAKIGATMGLHQMEENGSITLTPENAPEVVDAITLTPENEPEILGASKES